MSKHTPGPWVVGTPGPNGCFTIGTTRGLMTAMISHSINEKDQADTAIANASLIAAAPEMLAVLEMFIKNWSGSDVDWFTQCYEIERLAESAIAKAKGGAVNHFPDAAKMVPDGCAVLMTLDEAIDHANEKSIGSSQCAAQHAQLAKWLTDYRAMLAAAPKHEGGAS